MSECRRNRCFYMLVLSLAVIVLFSLIGVVKQHPVSADSGSKAAGPSSIRHSMGETRRPPVKITGWIYETTATHLLIGDQMLYMDPASPTAGRIEEGMYGIARATVDGEGQLHGEDLSILPLPGGYTIPSSVWHGVSVQPPEGSPGHAIEFRGIIHEIDPRYWIVDNRMVFITARTSIEGRPEIDALAEVKGVLLYGEIVLANSIKVTTPGAYAEVEFEGIIESVSEDAWIVDGITVTISPVTIIEGTPAVGAIAEVRGVLQPDDSVLAQQIIVTYPGIGFVSDVEGLVESIEATHWVIAGTTVRIDNNTFIDDSRAPAEVGMWALARGFPQQDGALLAVRIRLSRPD